MSSVTEPLTYCFEFERQVQGRLMLPGPFLVRAAQTFLDQTEVESGQLRFFDGGHVGSFRGGLQVERR